MKLIRNGLALLAATIAVTGCVSGSTSGQAVTFHSPAELEEIRKVPHVRVIDTLDYKEIRYPTIKMAKKNIRVVEYIVENGSWFDIFENKKYIYKNIEAYGYWGYHLGLDLKIYFVDAPKEPDIEYYRDIDYTYDYIVISDKSTTYEGCHYKFQDGDGEAVLAQLNRKFESSKPNPLPLAISAVLAKGTIRKSDICAPQDVGLDSPAASAEAPAQ